jgi:hypothetical protein
MSASRVRPLIVALAALMLLLAGGGLYMASRSFAARHADQRSRLATLDDLREANVITPDEYRRQAQRLGGPATDAPRGAPQRPAATR